MSADLVGNIAGGKVGDTIKNPVGSAVAEQAISKGVKEILLPNQDDEE